MVSACFIMTCGPLLAMEAAPRKKIREMVEFSESKHPRQVLSFIESYTKGTVVLGADNSVVFDDYLTKDISYSVNHSQATRLIESFNARKEQIREETRNFFDAWHENPFASNFTDKHVERVQQIRLLIFEDDADLDTLEAHKNLMSAPSKDLAMVRLTRRAYRKAFMSPDHETFSRIVKANIHGRDFCTLPEYVDDIQTGGRAAKFILLLAAVAAQACANGSSH